MKHIRTYIAVISFLSAAVLNGMGTTVPAWQPPSFTEWSARVRMFDDRDFNAYGLEDIVEQTLQDINQALDMYLKRFPFAILHPESVKKIVPPTGAHITTVSDLHGSAHSLLAILEHQHERNVLADNWKMAENHFFVSLGDNTDRGNYGLETLATLLFLESQNPGHVILLRGNHEYEDVNHSFLNEELLKKIIASGQHNGSTARTTRAILTEKILSFYSTMPLAIFVGNRTENGQIDYVVMSHAGIELDYHPGGFLAAEQANESQSIVLEQASGAHDANAAGYQVGAALESPASGRLSGFNATDFFEHIPGHESEDLWLRSKRGWQASHELLKFQLGRLSTENTHVHALIRGHQHSEPPMSDMLRRFHGINCDADCQLYTVFNAKVPYDLESDSYVEITTAPRYAEWTAIHWMNLPRIGWHEHDFLLSSGLRSHVQRPLVRIPSEAAVASLHGIRGAVSPSGRGLETLRSPEPLSPAIEAAIARLIEDADDEADNQTEQNKAGRA